ncbi:sodium/potassium/calcium exchanger 1-like [Chenopodium quinoa]|uniref:sodium/potassium/calcium exchanger 1-like n=1 Tax=Chenopodium quinoa TaxID=63459 RepID=UPI000B7762F9|nr:sodium/potassium/calcium exchanger 1-like [Chenopodium quinoa]
MEGSHRERYGKILKKAEKYLHRRQGSESSAASEPSVAPPIKGAGDDDGGSSYKAYLRKAKEFMQKKDDKENQVGDGNSDASAGDQDKKKQYAAIATGLLMARKTHKLMRKGRNKNGMVGQEGEEEEVEEEEEEEEEDEEVEDEESSGWFTEFIEGLSEFLGELEL